MKVIDRLENLISGLGTEKDKGVFSQFAQTVLTDDQLNKMFSSDWLSRKVVTIPVSDATREWRKWNADSDKVTEFEKAEKEFKLRSIVKQALVWGRLYGGGAIIIGAKTADPSEELDVNTITKGGLKYLSVLPRKMIEPGDIEDDIGVRNFGKPRSFRVNLPKAGIIDLHHSRVIAFHGMEAANVWMPTGANQKGWGDPVLQVVHTAVLNAALATESTAALIHDARVDVVSMEGLSETLSKKGGSDLVVKRFTNAALLKSIVNMLVLDQGEEWDRKQTSFTGLPDLIDRFLGIVAAAADIPVTRLLGKSPGGMNSTGESDLRNYYDAVKSYQNDELRPALERLDIALWNHAVGSIPDDADFTFNPLWQMSEKDRAEVEFKKVQTAEKWSTLGIVRSEDFARACLAMLVEDGTYPGLENARADVQPDTDVEKEESEGEGSNATGN